MDAPLDPSQSSEVAEKPSITAAQIADALEASEGNVSMAARGLGIPRNVLHNRIQMNPELVTLLQDMREDVIDTAEQNQFARAKSGSDPHAERFILQTIGKDRGYSTSVAGSGKDGEIVVSIKRFGE